MANYIATDPEITANTEYISTMFGAPVVTVELQPVQYVVGFNTSIEEYSSYITQWAIKANIANALGLDSATDFTMRWVAQNFEFAKSFAQAYSEQVNVGGKVPMYKDYFELVDGKQDYYLPNDIVVTEVMWQEPAAITRYLVDPNNNPAWVNFEFGWGYMGHSYMYIVPAYFSIQLAQATEMRWKIWRGDYTYAIRPAGEDTGRTGADYTGRTENGVAIYPSPTGGAAGTRVWYFYKKKSELNLYAEQDYDSVVSNPATIQMDQIPYSAFNSSAQRWVKQYSYAIAKEQLGNIRSKFSELTIPDATVTLDGELLRSEGIEAQANLKEYLFNELEAMDITTLIENDADAADNINRQLSHNPLGIYLG
jgi:hypothetical protein